MPAGRQRRSRIAAGSRGARAGTLQALFTDQRGRASKCDIDDDGRSELVAGMPRYPQTMINVRTERRLDPGESPAIRDAVSAAERELADRGRVVLRASGTEPVIRVMVEGEDEGQVVALAKSLADVVTEVAA